MPVQRLTLYQRAVFTAHLWKALTRQPHRRLAPIFAPYIPRDAVVLDVGAHAGQFTRLFKQLAPDGHVYAFEPASYARAVLQKVVRLRRLTGVRIIAAGLSDKPGSAQLSTPIKPRGDVGFGLAHLGEETRFESIRDEAIPITTIDTFAAENDLDRLDFIKADVEGWEVRMLAGAADTIARFRPAIVLELVDESLQRAGDSGHGAFEILGALGYSALALGHAGTPVQCDSFSGPNDYLFVPAATS